MCWSRARGCRTKKQSGALGVGVNVARNKKLGEELWKSINYSVHVAFAFLFLSYYFRSFAQLFLLFCSSHTWHRHLVFVALFCSRCWLMVAQRCSLVQLYQSYRWRISTGNASEIILKRCCNRQGRQTRVQKIAFRFSPNGRWKRSGNPVRVPN